MEDTLKKYDLKSLAVSLFTICSWPSNRSYMETCDFLNKKFLQLEEENKNGKQEIKNYEDFKTLFSDVANDERLPLVQEAVPIDIGQVHFYSKLNNGDYRVIIGNGSEDAYECCYALEGMISEKQEYKNVWKDILEYENKQMSFYEGMNFDLEKFSCPSEKYFKRIQTHFNELMGFNNLRIFFKDFSSKNEDVYSFFSINNGFPIFIPLMKECLLEFIERQNSRSDTVEGLWTAILNSAFNIYSGAVKFQHQIVGSPSFILNDEKIYLRNSFLIFSGENAILFCDKDEDSDYLAKITDSKVMDIEGMANARQEVRSENISINIKIQFVNTKNVSPNIKNIAFYDEDELLDMDANGLIGILNDAKSLLNIIDFVQYLQGNVDRAMIMTNTAGMFSVWQASNEVINEGAGNPTLFFVPYSQVQSNIDFFNALRNYPFNFSDEFIEPHRWTVEKGNSDSLSLTGKEGSGAIDVFRFEDKYFIYQETEFLKEEFDESNINALFIYGEIMKNALRNKSNEILRLLNRNYNELCVVSKNVFKENCKTKTAVSYKYANNVLAYKTKNSQILLVNPQWSVMQTDSFVSKTRLFENNVFDDSIEGFEGTISELKKVIHRDDKELRTTGAEQIEVPYFIKSNTTFKEPLTVSFKKARHIIAETIDELGLSAGTYIGEESLSIIRVFRSNLRDELLKLLRRYNRLKLHELLMNIYSSIVFEINIHKIRINKFLNESNIAPEYQQDFKTRTVKLREQARQYKTVLEYIIEENLLMIHRENEETPELPEVNVTIALAKWILDFQSQSDQVNYGVNGWSYLEILDNHVVNFVETERALEVNNEVQESKYTYGDYDIRDDKVDADFRKKFESAFEEDTGIMFNDLLKICWYISSNGLINRLDNNDSVETMNNVVKAPMDYLAQDVISNVGITLDSFYRCMKFITADINSLANDAGVIPVWERKQRSSRISLQPILTINKFCVYSPVVLSNLADEWVSGVHEFTIPYQVGMKKTTKVLNSWKKVYEDKIVHELVNIFKDKQRYDVSYNKEIYKYDPKGSHPRDLGDYDLIVVDKYKHKVLLIEAKYMRLNLTTKEVVEDQEEYFWGKKAKGKKFKRRVEYFYDHVQSIMKNKGYSGEFAVEGYFVANKIVRSFYEEYDFSILGFNEFKRLISKDI